MSYRTRVSDSFARLSADQLVTMAGGVIAGLTNNPAFPAPSVDLKTVEIAVDDLKTALAAQAIGGTAATAEKNNKQEALIAILRRLKHYVQDNCRDNLFVPGARHRRFHRLQRLEQHGVPHLLVVPHHLRRGMTARAADFHTNERIAGGGAAMRKSAGNIFDGRVLRAIMEGRDPDVCMAHGDYAAAVLRLGR